MNPLTLEEACAFILQLQHDKDELLRQIELQKNHHLRVIHFREKFFELREKARDL